MVSTSPTTTWTDSEEHERVSLLARARAIAVPAALLGIMLLAGLLRFTGQNWDQAQNLHPDERFITMVATGIEWPSSLGEYFDTATSPMNPYNHDFPTFIYGTFPLYLDKLYGSLTDRTVYGNFHLASRSMSAFFETAVTVTDADGCKNTDVLVIILNGSLFVPNTFTPNGDGWNDGFGAWGKDLREVELLAFNRWGELIWSTTQLDGRWDGTYHGVDSPIDTYVWKVKATELSGRLREAIGHVNLVR